MTVYIEHRLKTFNKLVRCFLIEGALLFEITYHPDGLNQGFMIIENRFVIQSPYFSILVMISRVNFNYLKFI